MSMLYILLTMILMVINKLWIPIAIAIFIVHRYKKAQRKQIAETEAAEKEEACKNAPHTYL